MDEKVTAPVLRARLGRLDMNMKSWCPELARVKHSSSCVNWKVRMSPAQEQSQRAAQGQQEFRAVLNEFVSSGTQFATQTLVSRMRFLQQVPARISEKVCKAGSF